MRFAEFIKKMPLQSDNGVNCFLNWAKMQTDFPSTSNPHDLAKMLYNKLNHQMTLGFQKCLMIYASLPGNEIPPMLLADNQKMLEAINKVIELQHADKNYKDF
jgi:hypothetical protein